MSHSGTGQQADRRFRRRTYANHRRPGALSSEDVAGNEDADENEDGTFEFGTSEFGTPLFDRATESQSNFETSEGHSTLTTAMTMAASTRGTL